MIRHWQSVFLGLAFVIAFVAASDEVRADNVPAAYTGNELIDLCNQGNFQLRNWKWTWCLAYVRGVGSALPLGIELGASSSHHTLSGARAATIEDICAPNNSNNEQAALIVAKYLVDHPTELNEHDALLIYKALRQAWPCTKSK